MSETTFYIIDAYAQIFRAYFAIRQGIRSPITGEPTHAVFGFTAMLLKLLQTQAPRHVLVAFDPPGKTFRDTLAPHYKATRLATPDELMVQIPRIFPLLDALGIPHLTVESFEADDIMASVVHTVLKSPTDTKMKIRLVSKDKDLEQCLGERVSIYDIHTEDELTVTELLKKKGIRPEQAIDFQTLTGDSVDNVPGVAGIGSKTATQLLQIFGSVDGIYANLDKLSAHRRINFEKSQPHIALSRTLLTLRHDTLPNFQLCHAERRPIDLGAVTTLFHELGFHRFQEQVEKLIVSEKQ